MKLLLFPFQIVILFFIFRSCFSEPKCNPDESSALLKLKAELPTDPNPPCSGRVMTRNWNESTNCCTWDGVKCDNVTGHVIGLDLDCGGIRGFITSNSSLFALTHLQGLHLSTNDFQGSSIVAEFGGFKNMTDLDLSSSNFSGDVPLEISHLSKLVSLAIGGEIRFSEATFKALSQNLTSLSELVLESADLSSAPSAPFTNFSSLTSLYLFGCKFHGEILDNILGLPKLQVLILYNNSELTTDHFLLPLGTQLTTHIPNSNNLSIDLPRLLRNGRSLTDLFLINCQFTNTSFTQHIPETHIHSNLTTLFLQNNFLNVEIPSWIYKLPNLSHLDLSYNEFTGKISDFKSTSLVRLSLRGNKLNGSVPRSIFQSVGLRILDLSSNSLSGPIPISLAPSQQSKNQFWGEISTSFCNMTSLQVLDLSDNNLSGKIPPCFSNFSSRLSVLDLRRNKLHGSIPGAFSKENSLRNLNLNGNQLEGALPRSLMNCSYLEVLDVGNNFLSGIFPDWIESLPELRVLVLRSNMFHGSIQNPKTEFPFQGVRIMDISNNKFSGPLPAKLFENFEAMTNAENAKMKYMGDAYYEDSIMVTLKGNYMELVKIQTILTAIDFSCNNFSGEIPILIGRIKSLKGLNFSHNMLSSTIPSTLGNLTNLEWLDLSSNSLVGNIPWQLAANLNQLQKLNLSSNKLEGPIPLGPQFQTFTEDSFSGNLRLCGFPLSKSCHEDPTTPKEESGDEESFNWKVVMMGYGSGLVIGISIGYMSLFSGRFDYWLAKRSVKAQQKKINIARSRANPRRRSN